jgi:hypothetical protein
MDTYPSSCLLNSLSVTASRSLTWAMPKALAWTIDWQGSIALTYLGDDEFRPAWFLRALRFLRTQKKIKRRRCWRRLCAM